jgi:hypothetical protein
MRYRRVQLRDFGRNATIYVHHIVADAFIGPRPEGLEVNHKDRDPSNNQPENLEYVTHSQNMRHAVATGRKQLRGADCPSAKLTEPEVLSARESRSAGTPVEHLARQHGVSHTTMHSAVTGKTWAHVGGPRSATPAEGHARGEGHYNSVLTEADVREIRRTYRRHCRTFGSGALGRKYGVTPQTIGQIVRGMWWKHLLAESIS